MFDTDTFYGHDWILATFCGFISPPPILAHLQHGWNPYSGFGLKHLSAVGADFVPGLPKLAWSTANLRFAQAQGWGRLNAIGAPFLYLLENLRDTRSEMAQSGRTGTLIYPSHQGARGGETHEHTQYLAELREREPPGSTVCLYWRDYESPDVRAKYEGAGFNVIWHGQRTSRSFLVHQREVILRHRRVVSNHVSSAIWYAAYLGLEVVVYGPASNARSGDPKRPWAVEQRDRWPELTTTGLESDAARVAAAVELGSEHLKTPVELSRLLGWRGPRRLGASLLVPVAQGSRLIRQRMASVLG